MAGFLGALLGGGAAAAGEGVAKPIEAIGNVFDKLFTSDEERAAAAMVMEKLKQHPAELQVQLNMVEAAHRSLFVAGWRPYIGWVLGTSLAIYYIPQFALASIIWVRLVWELKTLVPYPVGEISGLIELVVAMLGLAGLRTAEKVAGVSR